MINHRAYVLRKTDPADYDPPLPWLTFYIRLRPLPGSTSTDRTVTGLTDEEIDWIERSLWAEQERRKQEG